MAIARVAFYKGKGRLFNRLVAWWTQGIYSHCEWVECYAEDGRAVCWSSSFSDGGVRKKYIDLTPDKWDVVAINVPDKDLQYAKEWFVKHQYKPYDTLGLFCFIWDASEDSPDKWFCSEAVAAALGIKESWRFSPNDLFAILSSHAIND